MIKRIPNVMNKKEIVVVASGYFDPLHGGYIEYLKLAKQLGDKLIVIVNNDFQVKLKKEKSFMSEMERLGIIKELKFVDEVFLSIDKDRTVCKSLERVKPDIFAKGGDGTSGEIPESEICKKLNIKVVDGLGDKIQSSSDLIEKSRLSKVERNWGSYLVLEEGPNYKIKIIEVNPGHRLSLQKHFHRSEHWVVISGVAKVTNGDSEKIIHVNESVYIPKKTIHRLENSGKIPLKIVEVQSGEYLGEDDIERFGDDYGRVNKKLNEAYRPGIPLRGTRTYSQVSQKR